MTHKRKLCTHKTSNVNKISYFKNNDPCKTPFSTFFQHNLYLINFMQRSILWMIAGYESKCMRISWIGSLPGTYYVYEVFCFQINTSKLEFCVALLKLNFVIPYFKKLNWIKILKIEIYENHLNKWFFHEKMNAETCLAPSFLTTVYGPSIVM